MTRKRPRRMVGSSQEVPSISDQFLFRETDNFSDATIGKNEHLFGVRRQAGPVRTRNGDVTMTRKVHLIQPIPQLPPSRRGLKRLWISAILYLMACIWLGPTAAFWLTIIGAWTLFWFYLCGRFPVLGMFTSAFLSGLIGGLFGARGGGGTTILAPTIGVGGGGAESDEGAR
jgi:hypothetical protein